MDMDFLDTFQNEHYTPRLKQLFVDTSAWISENNASIQYSFTDAIDSACKDIAELQKKVWFQKFHAYVYRFFSHPYILKCLSSRLIVIQRDGFQREKAFTPHGLTRHGLQRI